MFIHFLFHDCVHLIAPVNVKVFENRGVFDLFFLFPPKQLFQNIRCQIKKKKKKEEDRSLLSTSSSIPTRQQYGVFLRTLSLHTPRLTWGEEDVRLEEYCAVKCGQHGQVLSLTTRWLAKEVVTLNCILL